MKPTMTLKTIDEKTVEIRVIYKNKTAKLRYMLQDKLWGLDVKTIEALKDLQLDIDQTTEAIGRVLNLIPKNPVQ